MNQNQQNAYILTFDVGTSSLKTSLFTSVLELVDSATIPFEPHADGSIVEMNAETYIEAMREGVFSLRETQRVRLIAITTQGETFVPIDVRGKPLSRAIVWLDARAERQADTLARLEDDDAFYEATGLPGRDGALPLCKLLWLKEHESGLYAAAKQILLLEDYLRLFLTGKAATTASLATSTGWLDVNTGTYRSMLLARCGLDENKLPGILPSGADCGEITRHAAAYLGLESSVRVYSGTMDQTAAALAACAEDGTVVETVGTAHALAAITKNPPCAGNYRLTTYRHTEAGKYLGIAIGSAGGLSLKWFRGAFCPDAASYDAIVDEAMRAKAGCGGVTFLPHLCGRIDPDPQPDAAAGFYGAGLSTARPEFARAIMEACGYELRSLLDLLTQCGYDASRVAVLGGGAKSAAWTQMRADMTRRTLIVPKCTEAASAGAALLAARGAGWVGRDETPVALGEIAERFTPSDKDASAYEAGYLRYLRLQDALTKAH